MYEKLDRSEGNVLGYEIREAVTEEDLNEILSVLESAIEAHDEDLRILLRLDSVPGFEFGALDDDLRFWLAHRDDIEKYAIVTDNSLIEGLVAVEDRLTDIGIREFDPEESEAAWAWLE
jgi:hypothetical protein